MRAMINATLTAYFKEIGSKGGSVRSEAKKIAAKERAIRVWAVRKSVKSGQKRRVS